GRRFRRPAVPGLGGPGGAGDAARGPLGPRFSKQPVDSYRPGRGPAAHHRPGRGQLHRGGAALIMFGMVAASGVCILQSVDFKNNRHNLFIFAISMGLGLIPMVAPKFFSAAPEFLAPLLNSGVLLSAISAMVLNLFFNGIDKSSIELLDNLATTDQ